MSVLVRDAIPTIFNNLKEALLDLPCTPERSLIVDQIDAAADSGDFIGTLGRFNYGRGYEGNGVVRGDVLLRSAGILPGDVERSSR